MSKYIGGLTQVGLARETTRGTPVIPAFTVPWVNFGFDDKVSTYRSEEALGNLDDSAEQYIGERWGEGDFEGEIRDKSFGLILYALMGTDTPAGAGPYQHVFTVLQSSAHPSLTLTVDDPSGAGDYQFPLTMINKLSLDIKLGELIRYSVGFMSKGSESAAAFTGAPTAENKFVPTQMTFKLAANRAGIAAATPIKVQNLKIEFNKNLLRKHFLGSASADDILNQTFSVEGSFQLPYEDQTYKNYMLNNTYKAMSIKIMNNDVALSGGGSPYIEIILPRVGFFDWTPARPKGALHEQTIGFKAYRDVTNSENAVYTITLQNSQATY